MINPFRVISKSGWFWNKLENANEMNFCNNESIWIITWNLPRLLTCKMSEINFKAILTTLTLYIGCELCTHHCECVGTKNSSFTEKQVSRDLRIEKGQFLPILRETVHFQHWFVWHRRKPMDYFVLFLSTVAYSPKYRRKICKLDRLLITKCNKSITALHYNKTNVSHCNLVVGQIKWILHNHYNDADILVGLVYGL